MRLFILYKTAISRLRTLWFKIQWRIVMKRVVLIVLLFGGLGGGSLVPYWGYGYGFGHGGVGLLGIILIVLVVLLLMGRL